MKPSVTVAFLLVVARLSGLPERRRTVRFELDLQARYRPTFSRTTKSGRVLNISTNGILFTVQDNIALGASVDVLADWPVNGEGDKPLKLFIQGRVVRRQPGAIALQIGRVELLAETQAEVRWNLP